MGPRLNFRSKLKLGRHREIKFEKGNFIKVTNIRPETDMS